MIHLRFPILCQPKLLIASCSLLFASCSNDALKQSRAQQAALQQEVDGITQQAAEIQAKITTLERQYPQFGATQALAAKEGELLMAANAYLEASIGVVDATIKETASKATRYRSKYLAP